MPQLAMKGGVKVRTAQFPAYRPIGIEEQAAAARVVQTGVLSRFLGTWHEDFYGGPEIQAFEQEWAAKFGVAHAIAVNSATSGLFCAMGAAGAGPGDEVIVSPYTMSASAVAPLVYNAIPIFADIEPDHFCLSPESVEKQITERTRAIIVVDILGQPYDVEAITAIARRHNLLVIEDCAQAICASYRGRWAGTCGDIGVYSLNYHKHIHTGEGGVIVTDNDDIAERLRLFRNHAEAVIDAKGGTAMVNAIGFNYRMTEIEAAIGREQLKKVDALVAQRRDNVAYLKNALAGIPCLLPCGPRAEATHSYYVLPVLFDAAAAGVSRNMFVDAVKAELATTELRETEGVKIGTGYVRPLYKQPLYQTKRAYGDKGCPWTCDKYRGTVDYTAVSCPVVEQMHYERLVTIDIIHPGMTRRDLDDVAAAFHKVWKFREELQ